jgi:hypothetical protein
MMTSMAATTRPFIPYTADSFLVSKAQGAPLDEARTKTFQSFMASFADQKKWKFPSIQGVGGNLWGTAYAMGQASDPIWKLVGPVNSKVADQLKNKGFHAPATFGKQITGTSDSPFCVIDRAFGITVFGTKASYKSGNTITVGTGACFWHSSNGLDGRNPKSNNKQNWSSRGRISEALVIRRDLIDYGIANNTDLGHVLHLFMTETKTADGFCHPLSGCESGKNGFGAEGERLVIRPTVNLDSRGMSKAGLVIAKTLQNYGCIIGDNAGGQSTLKAEVESAANKVWNGLIKQDELKGITWADFACVKKGWQ